MDCAQLDAAAAELALGILPGDQRAAAIAHLDSCAQCQQRIAALTVVADRLLLLLTPAAAPPSGFDSRVLAALATVPLRPTARRRIPGAVLAVAAGLIALLVAVGLGSSSSQPSVLAAEMRSGNGVVVGDVVVLAGEPAKVLMKLPGWDVTARPYRAGPTGYTVRITRHDGAAVVAPVTVGADSTWSATVDVDTDAIASAELVDRSGRVWCSATF